MRARPNPVEALVLLPRHDALADRAASWRQAITALSQSAGVGPPPLDGVEEVVLERAAHIALADGLVDDMSWILPDRAAVALYELTAALPGGRARRELGRRVFARLYEGTASTFAAVAQRMTLGSGKPLNNPTLRARVGLVLDLPIGSPVNADALALSLVTRRELHDQWVGRPSMGALPARRLAAKLLERAAREAMTRAQQGDPHALRLIISDLVRPAFERLLSDREPLVWQHAAVARGLIATVDARVRGELENALDPALSPTEWRRAAVSAVAGLVGSAEDSLRDCYSILDGPLAEADPGIAASMVMGLPRVIEAEPDLAEELLLRLAATERPDVAEAVASLLSDLREPGFAADCARFLSGTLAGSVGGQSSILRGVAARSMRLLSSEHEDGTSIGAHVRRALNAFESEGATRAYELAHKAIVEAHGAQDFLEAHHPLDENDMFAVLEVVAELDASVLERSRLHDLLLLGRRPGEADASVPLLDGLVTRMGSWLLKGEQQADSVNWSEPALVANQRRLKALLHVVDLETAESESDQPAVFERVRTTVQALLKRLVAGPHAMVHRIICATLARSFDSAVREGVAEPSDLLLIVATALDDNHSVHTIAEASTNPDLSGPLQALARFMGSESLDDPGDGHSEAGLEGATFASEQDAALAAAQRVIKFSARIGASGSYRGEAVRRVVFRLGRALEAAASARGLTELVDGGGGDESVIDEIEHSVDALRKLALSANRRMLDEDPTEISVVADVPRLSSLIDRAVRNGVPANAAQLSSSITEIAGDLPAALGAAIAQVLTRIRSLPIAPPSDVYAIPLEQRRSPLPDWLLPRRTIGAFYVVRALGAGGVSSVFVARRVEERHDSKADSFALKVPEYDPTTARSVSEQEFLQLFREEAGALLSLPSHKNLARFVTFDLGAKPKPILVMELIRGTGLDRLIRSRSLVLDSAFRYLDGILAGLEAMHGAGVGHLDVKPSNVILRDGETPVLVDFGLSGRQLRPGCGTLEYCAPEVLGVVPEGHWPIPPATDLYAFACTAYEILTGELLFDADDEMELVSQHVAHDGWPDRLARLAHHKRYADLCVVLAACLRQDPRRRPGAADTRRALAKASASLRGQAWPLAPQVLTEISA
ncbi:MAG TPA: serine/threonine-protein kinase [Polyangiaceae bacterium]